MARMTEAEKDAIILADAIRYAERMRNEYNGTDYCHSRNITGVPSEKNRTYRASDDCWKRGLRGRTVGVAPNTTATEPTVAITRDGRTTIVPANGFGRKSIHKKQREHVTTVRDNRPPLL